MVSGCGRKERATLELGPETDRELRAKLHAEVTAECFTRMDRAILAEGWTCSRGRPSLRGLRSGAAHRPPAGPATLWAGQGGRARVWTVSERLEPTMRELGERGDIVKAVNRALAARGQERGPETFNLHGREVGRPVVGRLIDKQLADGIGVVIDGIDGRVHHVSLPDSSAAEQAPIGAVVEVCGAGQDGVLFEHLIGYSNIDPLIASSTRTGVGS